MSEGDHPQVMTRRELEAKIIARAWQDEDFRRKFLADPKGQFEEHLGIKLPDSLVITAHQEDASSLHFVLPARPQVDMDELSDEDLEKVAGGVDLISTLVVTAGAVAFATIGAVLSLIMSAGGIGSAIGLGNNLNWGQPKK